jgi:hypothetical protein
MVDEAKGLVTSERAYLTLLLAKRASDMAGSLVGVLVSTVIAAAAIVFGSVAAAIALGRALGDPALGYLNVAGSYALLFIVFLSLWRGRLGERFKLGLINLLHGH